MVLQAEIGCRSEERCDKNSEVRIAMSVGSQESSVSHSVIGETNEDTRGIEDAGYTLRTMQLCDEETALAY